MLLNGTREQDGVDNTGNTGQDAHGENKHEGDLDATRNLDVPEQEDGNDGQDPFGDDIDDGKGQARGAERGTQTAGMWQS